MAKQLTADDILPLIAGLTLKERVRLIRLITTHAGADAAALYDAIPPRSDEFSTDEEPVAWGR